ncbi:Tetratricopeptide repeat protein [Vibrio crassostreae]|nr:hypothetical protein EDB36_101148 [Vibrio crassostreae]CAK1825848.1 Tetratricopeptide repeat protein [Vibrio crassostreae]CAK2300761.1 Tetratricopeptide repeat protein [Vibrio crassostreae]CAK2301249.1 Tetratricopeptide repeat protein [Vibrio crassostreae]CAK3203317.1 Tetratricopeptide repeat protein [Vibrio crassostreae]
MKFFHVKSNVRGNETTMNNYDKARELRKKALEIYNPINVPPSARLLSQALLYDPNYKDALADLSIIFRDGGFLHPYMFYAERAGINHETITLESDALELYENAMSLYSENPLNSVIEFTKVLCIDPTISGAYNNIAIFFVQQSMFEPALEYAKRAILHGPMLSALWDTYWKIINQAWCFIDDEKIASNILAKYIDYFEENYSNDRMALNHVGKNDLLVRVMPELKYIQKLQDEGEMMFKSTKFFRDLEDHDPRQDPNDNKPKKFQLIPEGKVVTVQDEIVDFGNGSLSLVVDAKGGSVDVTNMSFEIGGQESIYCFSTVSESNYESFFSNYEWAKLGGYALVINDINEFRNRVYESLNKVGKAKIQDGMVTYVPSDFMENIQAVFRPYIKSCEYQYEFEYRISCPSNGQEELLYIGSLHDISDIVSVEKLREHLKNKLSDRLEVLFP